MSQTNFCWILHIALCRCIFSACENLGAALLTMAAALTGAKGLFSSWSLGKMWDVWFISSRMLVGQQELSGLVIVPNMIQICIKTGDFPLPEEPGPSYSRGEI